MATKSETYTINSRQAAGRFTATTRTATKREREEAARAFAERDAKIREVMRSKEG